MSDTVTRCEMPPVGWTCSRDNGHDGPCAASPDTGSTTYGQFDVDFGETVFFERTHKEPSRSDDMKRRVWHGPIEPIAEATP